MACGLAGSAGSGKTHQLDGRIEAGRKPGLPAGRAARARRSSNATNRTRVIIFLFNSRTPPPAVAPGAGKSLRRHVERSCKDQHAAVVTEHKIQHAASMPAHRPWPQARLVEAARAKKRRTGPGRRRYGPATAGPGSPVRACPSWRAAACRQSSHLGCAVRKGPPLGGRHGGRGHHGLPPSDLAVPVPGRAQRLDPSHKSASRGNRCPSW